MAEHEELFWLARNLKLKVIKYSRQIYGPRGYAHLGDDDDDNDDDDDGGGGGGGGGGRDPETTPSYWSKKRHYQ